MREEKSDTSVTLQHKYKIRRGFSNYEKARIEPTVVRGILNLVEFHPKVSVYLQLYHLNTSEDFQTTLEYC